MVSIFGDRWYGEIQWNNIPEQHELNQYVIEVCKEFDVKVVSTVDSHYPNPNAWRDRELYKRLGWLGKGKPEWLEMTLPTSAEEIGYELYPKNGDQVWESYKEYSKLNKVTYDDEFVMGTLEETHDIAFNRIEKFYPDDTVRLPDFVVPAGYTEDEYLKRLTFKGLADAPNKVHKDQRYVARLEHELKVIADRGFSKYFLTMKAITDKTNEIQLSGPGRGSAAGSLVAYCLGITQVDPIHYGLLFSRFLRSDAEDYPDIDYDVSNPMALKETLIEEWGDNVVVPISNWNTLQLRSLIKDISKFYDIPFGEVNNVTSKMMYEATPIAKKAHGIKAGVYTPTFEEVMEYSETLRTFLKKYPDVKTHVEALHGEYRSCSRHAGGVVIGEELNKYMPLIASKGVRQTPWSEGQNVRQLEPMGFIKFDILGLSTLRMIEDCITKILQRHHGVESPTFDQVKEFYDKNLHPSVMNLDDQAVYKNVFHKGRWIGIFQFTEQGAQRFAVQAQPRSIIDIAAITSIYRPGPLSAEVDKAYVEAKDAPNSVRYLNDMVKEVTKETHGFLIFQEQIALLAHKLGKDLTLDEGNLLRKVLTKKGTGKGHEVKEAIKEKFIAGCREKGIIDHDSYGLWRTFEYFSGYGFNKSHAVSYSIISYQCAWLSHYYSTEWTAAFLDKEPETRKEKAINLAKQHGYSIRPLDINTSDMTWSIVDDKTLVAPLTTIKGLGEKAIDQILANRPFNAIEELLFNDNIVYSKLNKKALDVLCRGGALDNLIDDRFTGSKHFWYATCVDRPRTRKNLNDHIEKYRSEGSFSEEEQIEFIADLTGIFPMSKVLNEAVQSRLDELYVPAISDYDADLMVCWCVPRSITVKKSKNNRTYYVVEVIDINSVVTRIRCWSVDPNKDRIHLNRPYMIKPRYDDNWGFSTYGRVNNSWMLLD
jgi:DNA polymerase-3 subunit alpha